MSDVVTVRVTARQRVSYDQTVAMPRKEWERFKSMDESRAAEFLSDWIDTRNVIDADQIEDDFEAYAVDEEGNAVKPRDSYGD